MLKKIHLLLLLVIPGLFLLSCLLYIKSTGLTYLVSIDPEYAYLFNGLCLADFKFNLAHIDHPGTPVQMIVAITIWLYQLFSEENSFAVTAVKNPEIILQIANYFIMALNALGLYFLGKIVLKKNGKLMSAIFLQLFPFFSLVTLTTICRVRPEGLLSFTTILFMIITIKYMYGENRSKRLLKYTVLYSALMGFGMAVKISFFPFLIIPLFIIYDYRQRILYCISTAFFFLVFAFPILFQAVRFWRWATGLITHSGLYGKGNENILDRASFMINLKSIFTENAFFTIGIILLLFVSISYVTMKIKTENKIVVRLLLGILTATFLQIFIVAKHYKFYYLIPFTSLIGFVYYVVIEHVQFKPVTSRYVIAFYLYTILSLYVLGIFILNFKDTFQYRYNRKRNLYKTVNFIHRENIKSKPLLVVPHYYGGSTGLWALYFGNVWTGKHRFEYYEILKNIHPDAYIYLPWNNDFHYWGEDIDPGEIRSSYDEILVYIYDDNDEKLNKLINTHLSVKDRNNYNHTRIYQNDQTKESIYLFD